MRDGRADPLRAFGNSGRHSLSLERNKLLDSFEVSTDDYSEIQDGYKVESITIPFEGKRITYKPETPTP